jgi:hypothetical protein
MITLRTAEEKLKVNKTFLHGFIVGREIPTQEIGTAIAISPKDLARLRREIPKKYRTRKRRALAAAG